MKILRLLAIFTAVFLALTLSAKRSRADVTEAAYSDVRDIIEELLTAEISETIVPELACQARRIPVPAPVDAAGQPIAPDSPSYPRTVVSIDVMDANGTKHAQAYELFALAQFPRSLQRVYARQFGALKSSISEESADYAAYVAFQALIQGEPAAVDKDPIAVDKTIGRGELSDAAKGQFVPLKSAAGIEACVSVVRARFKAGDFQSRLLSPLEKSCAGRPSSYSCEMAFAVRAAILGKANVAQEQLLRATAEIVTEAVAQLAGTQGFTVTAAEVAKVREYVTQAVRDIVSNPNEAPAVIVTRLEADLARVLPCPGAAGCAIDLHTKLGEVLSRLRLQWSLSSLDGTTSVDLGTYATVFFSPDSALEELCTTAVGGAVVPRSTGLCRTFGVAKKVLSQAGALFPVVRAASESDMREVAHLAMAAMFKGGCGAADSATDVKCGSDIQAKNALYRRFAETVAVYVIDAADGKSPSDGTRVAFKSAAVDLIRSVSGPNGLTRRWYTPLWIPSFALRAAWSSGFTNHDGGNLRYVASVNWVGLRAPIRYTHLTYVALDFSLLDIVAPASEIALRDNVNSTYHDKGRVAANLLSPRVDLLLGIPALSPHLVVGAGAALRYTSTLRTKREVQDGVVFSEYDYRWWYQDKANFGRFIDFGFFAKYLL